MAAHERFLTAEQSRQLDIQAWYEYHVPALILMENAGRQVAQASLRMYNGRKK